MTVTATANWILFVQFHVKKYHQSGSINARCTRSIQRELPLQSAAWLSVIPVLIICGNNTSVNRFNFPIIESFKITFITYRIVLKKTVWVIIGHISGCSEDQNIQKLIWYSSFVSYNSVSIHMQNSKWWTFQVRFQEVFLVQITSPTEIFWFDLSIIDKGVSCMWCICQSTLPLLMMLFGREP